MTRAFSPLLSWSYLSLYLFRVFRLAALLAAVLVTSCGGGDTVDLQNYVAQVKSQEKGRIEPLPQFKPFKTFAYNAVLEKDPFAAWVTERIPEQIITENGVVQQSVRARGISPDFDRRKELLEQYPLDSLNMLGTLELDNELWAIVSDPDKIVHRVKVGNYIGQNFGKIVDVKEGQLSLRELVVDGLGDWQVREASIALTEAS